MRGKIINFAIIFCFIVLFRMDVWAWDTEEIYSEKASDNRDYGQ